MKDRESEVIKLCMGKDVLDVGCVGDAKLLGHKKGTSLHVKIRSFAASVLGIDNDQEGIKRMKQIGFNVCFADAQNFDLKQKFDVVFCGHTLQHFPDIAAFLRHARNHLRPGGRLVVTVPNVYHLPALFMGNTNRPNNRSNMVGGRHYNLFSERTLRNLLEVHGFDVEKIEYCDDTMNIRNPIHRSFIRLVHNIAGRFKVSGSLLVVARVQSSSI
jgi:2-polyprenyl-3-methyl-5-hydroxy-6-metoxy-1,4-benzoquinol methylase